MTETMVLKLGCRDAEATKQMLLERALHGTERDLYTAEDVLIMACVRKAVGYRRRSSVLTYAAAVFTWVAIILAVLCVKLKECGEEDGENWVCASMVA